MRHFIAVLFALACVAQVRDIAPRVFPAYQIGVNMPSASTYVNSIVRVTNGASATDCTVGGGSTSVWCQSNGTVWSAFSGGNVNAGGTLTSNAPVIGAGNSDIAVGSRSGNTTEFATITGTKTTGKQLEFDASGNVKASTTDIGAGGGSSSIFQFVAQDRQDHISRCNLEIAESGTAVSLCSYPSDDDSYYSTYVMFVPASYTSGTVTAVVQWAHASGTDASKTFKFDLYLACKMAAFGSANTLTVNDTTATDHSIITATALDLTNTSGTCAAGDLARLKITRQPNANFTSTVGHWIAGVKVTWP